MENPTFFTTEKLVNIDPASQQVSLKVESTKKITTDGVVTYESIDFDLSNLPNWVSLSSKEASTDNKTHILNLQVNENTDTERRSIGITLTQKDSGKSLAINLVQDGKPKPVENYLSYHVDHKSMDDSYDYYDVYFQAEKAVASNVTLEVSIDSLGQATGYSFIIDSGETRSPYFEMKANKGVLGELGLLEVISIDPTEDEVYQYKVTMP